MRMMASQYSGLLGFFGWLPNLFLPFMPLVNKRPNSNAAPMVGMMLISAHQPL
jgi:hypothetical protein